MKNLKEKLSQKSGITLLALVITIIVLIILAAVSISVVFGQDGIVARAQQAVTEHKKAQYMEKLQLDLMSAQAEMLIDPTKSITEILHNIIEENEWVEKIEVYDDEGNIYTNPSDFSKGTKLLITTKDNRVMMINTNNLEGTASINEEYFPTADEASVTVTFDKNGNSATGSMSTQNAIDGFSIVLPECSYTNTNFVFTGWSKYPNGKDAQNNVDIHLAGSRIQINGNTTLYAQWSRTHTVIKFNGNGATGGTAVADKTVQLNTQTSIEGINTYQRAGYFFKGWSTEPGDGQEVKYTDTITVTENVDYVQLYAQWQLCYTITFEPGTGGSGTMTAMSNIIAGETVTLKANSFTHSSLYFNGWREKTTGTTYTNRQQITVNSNLTLVAQWASTISITGESLLKAVGDNDLIDKAVYSINVNGQTYTAHVYNYEGNQTWSGTKTFGAEDDVSTTVNGTRQYAQNMVIVKVNGDLTNNGTIQPYFNNSTKYGGPKGLMLYVTGKLTNNGTIDNSHGAYALGQDVYLWKNENGQYEKVPATGASGGDGAGGDYCRAKAGSDGKNRSTAGGGGGAARYSWSKPGVAGTSYSGGCSGAAGGNNTDSNQYGGSGGYGDGIGGTGNPGGGASNGNVGSSGTGGLLIVYANNYQNTGELKACGTTGIRIEVMRSSAGSSGGGSINVFYKELTSLGSHNAAGGSAVVDPYGGYTSGAGGTGSISVGNISTGTYVSSHKNY